jgi:hypothetical protein
MILQISTRHELIDKKAMFIFKTVPKELYKIWV